MVLVSIQFYFLEKIQLSKYYIFFYFFVPEVTLNKINKLVIKDRISTKVKGDKLFITI